MLMFEVLYVLWFKYSRTCYGGIYWNHASWIYNTTRLLVFTERIVKRFLVGGFSSEFPCHCGHILGFIMLVIGLIKFLALVKHFEGILTNYIG